MSHVTASDILATPAVGAEEDFSGIFDDMAAPAPAAGASGVVDMGASADVPPAVLAAELCMVREPTKAELKAMTTIEDVAQWARLKGPPAQAQTLLGSLLRLFADIEDVQAGSLWPEDVAQVTPVAFEHGLLEWRFSRTKPTPDMTPADIEVIQLECVPKEVDIGKARAFYHATRLLSKLEVTRDKAHKYRSASRAKQAVFPIVSQVTAPATPPASTRSGLPASEGELCLMGAIMGGRKNREIKECPAKIFSEGLARYKWMNYGVGALLENRPSRRQYTCVLAQLDEDPPVFSADYATFCPQDARTQKSKISE